MIETISKAVALLLVPFVVFVLAGLVMVKMTGRPTAAELAKTQKITSLNMRFLGYDKDTFFSFYFDLRAGGRQIEKRFLEADLIYPFLYGGAMALSLLGLWVLSGRPWNPVFIFLPVALFVAADWTENLIHLNELAKFTANPEPILSAFWIRVASFATILKLWLIVGSVGLQLVLFVMATLFSFKK